MRDEQNMNKYVHVHLALLTFVGLLTFFIVGGPLFGVLTSIVPFFLKKKYPHACKHSTFKLAMGLVNEL